MAIVERDAQCGGVAASFQLRVEALDNVRPCAGEGAALPFVDPGTAHALDGGGRDAAEGPGWCQADLQRAIEAARKAGLRSYRIEATPDGAIAIVVGDSAADAPPPGCR